MTNSSLGDKRVVVIGGSSGVGLAVAQVAVAEGARVVIGSSQATNVAAAVASLGPQTSGHAVDVTDEASVAAFFDGIDPFDHLVFTAGDWGSHILSNAVAEMDFATVGQGLDVRVWGALKVVKHALLKIAATGSITLTDGILTHKPHKGAPLTTAFSGAIEYLIRGLAVDLAPIRVNTVCLGTVLTGHMASAPPEMIRQLTQRQLIPRAAEPVEAAQAYLYAMRGSFTTGQVLVVDGGALLV